MSLKHTVFGVFAVMSLVLVLALPANAQQVRYAKLAPFSDIEWVASEKAPRVFVSGSWYLLQAVDDISIEEMTAFAKDTYAGKWQKRIGEDLVQVMSEMGHPPADVVKLRLKDTESEVAIVIEGVAMTSENREALMAEQQDAMRQAMSQSPLTKLTGEQARADVAYFEELLESQFAYLEVNDVGFKTAIKDLYAHADQGMTISDLQVGLQQLLGLFIDGHSDVSLMSAHRAYLPFLMRPTEGRVAAFQPERTALLNKDYPYVVSIDGLALSEWKEALRSYIPRGSAQYLENEVLRRLRRIQEAQKRAGLARTVQVDVELESEDGASKITEPVYISDMFPVFGTWPQTSSEILTGNIGYLRLPKMNGAAVLEVQKWMPKFEDTDGLIIDVRGNTGGGREALFVLFPYFMSSDDKPYVANAAKYRLGPLFAKDHLEARFMYRANADQWSNAERQAITTFQESFKPVWEPPAEKFSDWHFLVLSREAEDERYHYTKPVVILMNDRCFSATDIFLSAFKGWENVTLMGTPSSGGSARSQSFFLPNSGLIGRIASMASFQKDGSLYDGNGVMPDIEVHPETLDFLKSGKDNVLNQAILHHLINRNQHQDWWNHQSGKRM